jgi:Skp family chaperone for outer membrane proteins
MMLALLLTLQLSTGPSAQAQAAILNMPRLVAETVEGKAASAKLEALRADRQKTLSAKEGEVRALIQKKAAPATIERSQVELRRMTEDAEAEMNRLQRTLELDFFSKIQPVVKQILNEERLVMILTFPNPIIVWAAPAVDITPKVIQRLDATARTKR